MPSEPKSSKEGLSDGNGDLPDPTSGETFTDLGNLAESIREEASGASEGEEAQAGDGGEQSPEAGSGKSDGSETVRMTFHVDKETAERLRNAVYWTATPVTLSGTARDALRAAVRRLEAKYNDGEPFPERDEELRGGNPNLKG